jgi:PAS domain-containing protein
MNPHRPLGLHTHHDVLQALSGIPAPAYVFDMTTLRFLDANSRFIELLGYSEPELRELTIERIRPQSDVGALHQRLKERPPAGLVHSQYVRKDLTLLDIKVHYRNVAYTNDAGATVTARLVVVEFWQEA